MPIMGLPESLQYLLVLHTGITYVLMFVVVTKAFLLLNSGRKAFEASLLIDATFTDEELQEIGAPDFRLAERVRKSMWRIVLVTLFKVVLIYIFGAWLVYGFVVYILIFKVFPAAARLVGVLFAGK